MAETVTWQKVKEIFSVNSVEGGKPPVTDVTVWVPSKKNPFWEFKLDVRVTDNGDGTTTETEVFRGRKPFTEDELETDLTEEMQDFIVRAWQVSGSDVFDALENEMVNRA